MAEGKFQLTFASAIVAALILSTLIPLATLTPVTAASPYLKVVKEYYYAPLLDSNPHGKLNLIVTISKLKSDGVSDYDWYFYSVKIQTVPGKVAYGSDWRTAATWANHKVWNPGTYRWLVDYDPTTTVGQTTATVSLTAGAGPTGPSVGFGVAWSYTVSDVTVYDTSDFSQHTANWHHDINEHGNPGMYTYLSRPGFVVKTKQNYWSFVDASYKVLFTDPLFWVFIWLVSDWKELASSTLYLDAFESGD
jgi:hypothetical protein